MIRGQTGDYGTGGVYPAIEAGRSVAIAVCREHHALRGQRNAPQGDIMTVEFPADIAALLDEGASIDAINTALRAFAGPRAHGIKTRTAEWTTISDESCARTGLAEIYCVHIEFDDGTKLDRCGSQRCVK